MFIFFLILFKARYYTSCNVFWAITENQISFVNIKRAKYPGQEKGILEKKWPVNNW